MPLPSTDEETTAKSIQTETSTRIAVPLYLFLGHFIFRFASIFHKHIQIKLVLMGLAKWLFRLSSPPFVFLFSFFCIFTAFGPVCLWLGIRAIPLATNALHTQCIRNVIHSSNIQIRLKWSREYSQLTADRKTDESTREHRGTVKCSPILASMFNACGSCARCSLLKCAAGVY